MSNKHGNTAAQIGNRNAAKSDKRRNLPKDQQADLLPDWASKAIKGGASIETLLRADGLGIITQKEFEK